MKPYSKILIKLLVNLDCVCKGAEIGVWRGANAFNLLSVFSNLDLILVDDYDKKKIKANGLDPKNAKIAKKQALENLKIFDNRCTWLKKDSLDAAFFVEQKTLDFAFLDADHHYKNVLADINIWLPKIKPGGILCGHDYSGHFPGVKRAVTEKFGEEGFNLARRGIWWYLV